MSTPEQQAAEIERQNRIKEELELQRRKRHMLNEAHNKQKQENKKIQSSSTPKKQEQYLFSRMENDYKAKQEQFYENKKKEVKNRKAVDFSEVKQFEIQYEQQKEQRKKQHEEELQRKLEEDSKADHYNSAFIEKIKQQQRQQKLEKQRDKEQKQQIKERQNQYSDIVRNLHIPISAPSTPQTNRQMLSPRQQERQSSYNPDQIAPSRQLSQVSVVAASSVHGEGQQQRTPHKNQFHSIPRSATQSPGPQQSPNPNKLNPQNFLKRSKQPMFLKPAPSAVAQAVQKSGGSVDKELYKTVNQQQQEQQNALLQSQLQQQISTPFTVFNPNQAGDSGAVFVTPQGMKNNDKQGQHKMPVFNANTSPTKTILDILSYTPQCMLNDPFTSSPSKQQMQNSPPRSPLKQQRRGNRTKGDGFGVTSSSAQSNYGDNNDQSQENLLIIKLNRLIGAISIEEQQLKRTTTPVGFEAKLEELLQKRDLELSEVEKKLNELQELHGNPQQ